jgi:hypothetical protein
MPEQTERAEQEDRDSALERGIERVFSYYDLRLLRSCYGRSFTVYPCRLDYKGISELWSVFPEIGSWCSRRQADTSVRDYWLMLVWRQSSVSAFYSYAAVNAYTKALEPEQEDDLNGVICEFYKRTKTKIRIADRIDTLSALKERCDRLQGNNKSCFGFEAPPVIERQPLNLDLAGLLLDSIRDGSRPKPDGSDNIVEITDAEMRECEDISGSFWNRMRQDWYADFLKNRPPGNRRDTVFPWPDFDDMLGGAW